MNSDFELRGATELDDGKLLLVLLITEQEQLVKSGSVYFDYDEAGAYFAYDENDRLAREYRLGTAGRWGPAPWGLFGWGGADATYFDYAYDEAANRTRSGLGTRFVSPYCTYFKYEATYYEYAADDSLTKRWRADTGAGTYYEYDKTGSCEKIVSPAGVTYFEYTHANLVSKLIKLGGSEFQFAYDGNRERYAVVEDGVSTYYLWDDLRLVETRNADYSLKARFAHGPARVGGIGTCTEVYRASDGKRYYMLYDHRGSAHVVMDEGKSVVATRLYGAFGEIISETGAWPAEVPFGYQSNWLAPPGLTLPDGTQLYLPPTRAPYDPKIGRFLQRDFKQTPGENAYVYALNNPVNLVDPEGLEACNYDDWTIDELVKESQRLREVLRGLHPDKNRREWRDAVNSLGPVTEAVRGKARALHREMRKRGARGESGWPRGKEADDLEAIDDALKKNTAEMKKHVAEAMKEWTEYGNWQNMARMWGEQAAAVSDPEEREEILKLLKEVTGVGSAYIGLGTGLVLASKWVQNNQQLATELGIVGKLKTLGGAATAVGALIELNKLREAVFEVEPGEEGREHAIAESGTMLVLAAASVPLPVLAGGIAAAYTVAKPVTERAGASWEFSKKEEAEVLSRLFEGAVEQTKARAWSRGFLSTMGVRPWLMRKESELYRPPSREYERAHRRRFF